MYVLGNVNICQGVHSHLQRRHLFLLGLLFPFPEILQQRELPRRVGGGDVDGGQAVLLAQSLTMGCGGGELCIRNRLFLLNSRVLTCICPPPPPSIWSSSSMRRRRRLLLRQQQHVASASASAKTAHSVTTTAIVLEAATTECAG